MTIANMTATELDGVTVDPSFTHTPVGGNPNGVLVLLSHRNDRGLASAVTYGGTSMAEVALSANRKSTGEAGWVGAWFLGSSVPTGAQTVAVTGNGNGDEMMVTCYTVTAAGDIVVEDTDNTINSDSATNPSATLALGGKSCFVAQACYSGTTLTALAGWTAQAIVWYASGHYSCMSYDTIGTTDVTTGWNQVLDDAIGLSVAIREDITAAAITSVGGDDVVLDAEANVAFVTSGFSSEISTVQLVSGTSTTNGSSVSSTSGTGTFVLPDITLYTGDVIGCPLTTTNNVVVARLTDA